MYKLQLSACACRCTRALPSEPYSVAIATGPSSALSVHCCHCTPHSRLHTPAASLMCRCLQHRRACAATGCSKTETHSSLKLPACLQPARCKCQSHPAAQQAVTVPAHQNKPACPGQMHTAMMLVAASANRPQNVNVTPHTTHYLRRRFNPAAVCKEHCLQRTM